MAAIKDYVGAVCVCYLGWNYGFIQHGESEKDNIYFHKNKVVSDLCDSDSFDSDLFDSDLFDSIHVNDVVTCDAEVVKKQSSKYRATRVQVEIEQSVGLYNCKGTVSKLDKSDGQIEADAKTVFFYHRDFYSENKLKVECIEEVLKIGDFVYFDAIKGSKWRATRVWTKPPHTSENSTINKEGTILSVSETEGLISFGSDTFSQRIFFSIDAFYEHGERVDDLTSVLRRLTEVKVEAKTWEAENGERIKCQWIATRVWIGDPPKSNKSSTALCNVEGIIVKVLAQRAIFRFADQSRDDNSVGFDANDFYDDGKKVLNLEWCLKVGDKVNFDAMLAEDDNKWRAVVVWKGDKPNHTTIIDKMKCVEQYLEKNCPLIKSNDINSSDVPVVTVSSENCSQNGGSPNGGASDGTSEFDGTGENDLKLTVNEDTEENQAVEISAVSKCQIMLKKIDSLAEKLNLKDDLQNGDVEDGIKNYGNNSFCSNFEKLMEDMTTIADILDRTSKNIQEYSCNERTGSHGDGFKEIVESSTPRKKEASTQTLFTGEIFCSHVYVEP